MSEERVLAELEHIRGELERIRAILDRGWAKADSVPVAYPGNTWGSGG